MIKTQISLYPDFIKFNFGVHSFHQKLIFGFSIVSNTDFNFSNWNFREN